MAEQRSYRDSFRQHFNMQSPEDIEVRRGKAKFRGQLPTIGGKEIPVHYFSKTLNHFTLNKNGSGIGLLPSPIPATHSPPHSQRAKPETASANYNRPTHLLRQYLDRRNKLIYGTQPTPQPDKEERVERKTMSEFRVKKNKRSLHTPPNHRGSYDMESEGESYVELGSGKNLYSMSKEELEESIKWKKRFLEVMERKVRGNKAHDSHHYGRV